jgi:Flp pilus assembly protein TadD
LGKLQVRRGDVKSAVANLETAAELNPQSSLIHHELAAAYRKDSRPLDAQRETKLANSFESKPAEDSSRPK